MSERTHQSPRGESLTASNEHMLHEKLWLKILIGIILGIGVGLILSPSGLKLLPASHVDVVGAWIALPGTIFISLIQMVVVPLVFCSIVLGISTTGDMAFLKRMSFRILPYFVFTTACAIAIGMALVNIIQPGHYIAPEKVTAVMSSSGGFEASQTFEDLTVPQRIANLIPTNLSRAFLEKNLLQIVIVSMITGVALISVPKSLGKPLEDLCISGQVITMKVISWAMSIAPIAVFGLLCQITIRIGIDAIIGMGVYVITVLLGLIGMLLAYLLIVFLVAGHSPFKFLSRIREAQLIAFSTSSSAATMPISIKVAEEKMHVRQEISRFVIPLGATINMDGTALYQGVAAIFLYQVFGASLGVTLELGDLLLLLITTVGASIGTPAVPGVGIVVLATILTGIGIEPAGIALILGVDRILDMCRTTINVTGDLTAAAVMNKWLPDTEKLQHYIQEDTACHKNDDDIANQS
jgi:Na+/H+-dicarboxylate symporter